MQNKRYTARISEICDNGDAILDLPPELCEELGWQAGDTVDISEKDGKIFIKKIDNADKKISLDK